MKYRAEIDGLRALAVLPVILFHAGFEWFSGGFVGVDVFFVISGYLITTIIISEMDEGKFSIINFYERRARRILPALFFVLMVCIPLALFLLAPSDLVSFGKSLIGVSTFLSNVFFWAESGYFDTASELKPLLHTWSLAVEEQFYILFPVFLIIIWKFGIKWVSLSLVILFLMSLGLAQWGAYNKPSATFFLLPTRGWELLIGALSAVLLTYRPPKFHNTVNQALGISGLLLIAYSISFFDERAPFPSFYALLPTVGTFLIIISAAPETAVQRLLSNKAIVGLGLISYSAYLWHQPLLSFARHWLGVTLDYSIALTICFMSLVLAWLSWRYVEAPFRKKKKFGRKFIFLSAACGCIFFASFGYYVSHANGFLSGYSKEYQKIYSKFFDSGSYVKARAKSIGLATFNKNNKKIDLMIIGDSHSQDLINAIYEAGLDESYEISSFVIPVKCGVLFVDEKADREWPGFPCTNWKDFDEKFFTELSRADEVWIASSWKPLDAKYMDESLANISSFHNKVTVFGKKGFGKITAGIYRNNDIEAWQFDYRQEHEKLRDEMLNSQIEHFVSSNGMRFINTQNLFCPTDQQCANYQFGDIVSYDGSHLTPFGARLLGNRLKTLLASESLKTNEKSVP